MKIISEMQIGGIINGFEKILHLIYFVVFFVLFFQFVFKEPFVDVFC